MSLLLPKDTKSVKPQKRHLDKRFPIMHNAGGFRNLPHIEEVVRHNEHNTHARQALLKYTECKTSVSRTRCAACESWLGFQFVSISTTRFAAVSEMPSPHNVDMMNTSGRSGAASFWKASIIALRSFVGVLPSKRHQRTKTAKKTYWASFINGYVWSFSWIRA